MHSVQFAYFQYEPIAHHIDSVDLSESESEGPKLRMLLLLFSYVAPPIEVLIFTYAPYKAQSQ